MVLICSPLLSCLVSQPKYCLVKIGKKRSVLQTHSKQGLDLAKINLYILNYIRKYGYVTVICMSAHV